MAIKSIQKNKPQIEVLALCIITRDNSEILACRGHDDVKNEDFGRILGGHVEFGETAEFALRREFKEELNAELENLRLLDVLENIFTYNGKPGHQITFLYAGNFVDSDFYKKDKMKILDADFEAVWYKISDIQNGKVKVYPEFDYTQFAKFTKTTKTP